MYFIEYCFGYNLTDACTEGQRSPLRGTLHSSAQIPEPLCSRLTQAERPLPPESKMFCVLLHRERWRKTSSTYNGCRIATPIYS